MYKAGSSQGEGILEMLWSIFNLAVSSVGSQSKLAREGWCSDDLGGHRGCGWGEVVSRTEEIAGKNKKRLQYRVG